MRTFEWLLLGLTLALPLRSQTITTVGGNTSWGGVYQTALDADGNLYAADFDRHVVYKVDRLGATTTIAGTLGEIRPVVMLVERGCATDPEFQRLRLPPGTALVLYRHDGEPTPPLASAVRRLTLADLVLPWERQRLIAMVQRLTERAVAAGRAPREAPPEERAP